MSRVIFERLRQELQQALAAHDCRAKEPWGGPCTFNVENDRIERARIAADGYIVCHGLWPRGKRFIGNDECLHILASGKSGKTVKGRN